MGSRRLFINAVTLFFLSTSCAHSATLLSTIPIQDASNSTRPALLGTIQLALNNTTLLSAIPAAPSVVPAGAGAINAHDMNMLKNRLQSQEAKEDFKKIQEKNDKSKIDGDSDDAPVVDQSKLQEKKEDFKAVEPKSTPKTKKVKKKSFAKEHDLNKSQTEPKEHNTSFQAQVEKVNEPITPVTVYVEDVIISNSDILTDQEIKDALSGIKQKTITFEKLQFVVDNINNIYASKGFVTARAYIPAQTIENGIVRIELVEGKVGNITIDGNRWTKSNYIKKRMFSAKTDEVFNVAKLEKDIVKFNRYNDGVKLHADLLPGEVEGTTDIQLHAVEKFPFRLTGLLDNAGRKTIGETRTGAVLVADSLFGQRDRLTTGIYSSKSSFTPYADYNIPVNKYDGRLGFTYSVSKSQINEGPYKMFNIASRSYNHSLYYTHPLIRKPFFELGAYVGVNFKQGTTSFDEYDLYTDKISSGQLSLNARWDTRRGIWYGTQGYYQAIPIYDDASKYWKYEGSLIRLHDFGHDIVGQFRGSYQYIPQDVVPYIDQFQAGGIASVRGYSEGVLIGKSGWFISGELLFPIAPKEITLRVKKKKIDPNIVDVAHVQDGSTAAKTEQADIAKHKMDESILSAINPEEQTTLSAQTKKTAVVRKIPFIGKYVKGLVFIDSAGVFPFKGSGPGAEPINSHDYLVSIGVGLRVSLPKDFNARIYWGYPIIHNIHEPYYKSPRMHFELSLTPDFDTFLKFRKRKQEEKNVQAL